ncbi:hypothetical protein [Pelomonas sp. KK5]|uniref:hypothetical protein n=1 Tax=Pelomonas sp. KK5 TaxID=1855730 RepID=UPI00097C11F1|nr:hypothetical protein [Pelomonas sp. KK5]
MKYLLPLTVFLTLNFSGSSPASAETESRSATVYHCGKDGRELRDAPCPGEPKKPGSQVNYDQPSDADARATREQAAADAKRADTLQKDRLRQEAEQRRRQAAAARLSPGAAAPAASAPARPLVATKPKLKRPHKPKTNAG